MKGNLLFRRPRQAILEVGEETQRLFRLFFERSKGKGQNWLYIWENFVYESWKEEIILLVFAYEEMGRFQAMGLSYGSYQRMALFY
jgi:hypothetical protein